MRPSRPRRSAVAAAPRRFFRAFRALALGGLLAASMPASPGAAAEEPVELYGAAADEAAATAQPVGAAEVAPEAPSAPSAPTVPSAPPGGYGAGAPQRPPPGVDPFVPTDATHPTASAPLPAGDPPGRIGRLGLFEGKVSLRAGAPEDSASGVWLEASRNRPVVAGDSIWADQNSRAELHLGSLEVRLGAETLVQVLLLDDAHVRLGLLQGTLELRRHVDGDHGGSIEVCPPGMVVELEGAGSYRFDVGSDGRLRSLVARDGGRAVARGEQQTLQVATGERLQGTANDNGELQLRPAAGQTDAFDAWSEQRAQAQNSATSLRYVSRNMVGYEDLDGYGDWTSSPVYGPLWGPRQVSAGWAPFRTGHWANVAPWGWTWVDDAPWGFAPFHYGRWVYVGSRWYWAPGAYAAYPIYAPHMVAFAGGGIGFGSGFGRGGYWGSNVGWYPLGFYDPFYPAYPCSYGYAHGLNGPRPLPHFGPRGPGAGNGYGPGYGGPRGVGGPRVPGSITVAPRGTVMGGLPVGPAHRPLPPQALGQIGRVGWGGRMPIAHVGGGVPGVGAVAHPPGGAGFAGSGVAAPPAAVWARGGGVGRGPNITGPNGARLGQGGPRGPRIGTAVVPGTRMGTMPMGVQPMRPGYMPMPGPAPAPGYRAMPAYRFEPHYEQHGFGGGAHFAGPRPGGFQGGSMGTFHPGPSLGGAQHMGGGHGGRR